MKKAVATILFFNILLFADFNTLTSFQARFHQTITNEQNSTIRYEGLVFAKNGNRALWKYEKPIVKSIYYLGELVVVIEPELEQAIVSHVDKKYDILEILKNAKKIGTNRYEAKCCQNVYTIFTKDGKIEKIAYKDKLENRVFIDFYEQKINQNIDNKIFEYNIPFYYDVIKER
jgi:outer membrane lipoprotein carrier protein